MDLEIRGATGEGTTGTCKVLFIVILPFLVQCICHALSTLKALLLSADGSVKMEAPIS